MLEKYNRYKLLKIFLDSPNESFRLRELSRMSKISPPSVINYLSDFEKEGLIKKQVKRDIPFYAALRDNNDFVTYKKLSIIFELNRSGLVDYIWEKASPEAIVLYGSSSRGEAIEDSDIDLFIISKETKAEVNQFEKKLGKKIHLLIKKSLKEVPIELRNNIINGIVLKGYIKAF